jgi:hypothetical protein
VNAYERTGTGAPFDAIRIVTLEGREYWSARDLIPLLGYERWERFADAIFGGKWDGQYDLYSTEEAAMRGHLAAVDALRAGKAPFAFLEVDAW